ncbi:hypothetical protein FEM48_Zijuj09G0118800 [Ziziphus jujuba var. spinosa]|uniref:Alpha/beta hydrolase fold-3 domain-containing protein n=1 Tax=Ziziphus jujuba var. spinosa TaxID=714518 RepID=A0A978USV1_ZIZJJ|nr:hypothetical protein FEM48_Zijuj09G0118800 [Ziziphus jujuba var. spinosa]
MDDDVAIDFYSLFRIYKDGRVQRFAGTDILPPSPDPKNGDVRSKDVVISPETGLSARLFLPDTTTDSSTAKLPFLIYIHGGAFCIGSPFSPIYHNHVASLTAGANVVALSLHYRRAPEHPLPTAFEDAWEAFQWAVGHSDGDGPEEWLNRHADFRRVFFAGDSAGATIAHNVVVRAGVIEGEIKGLRIVGMVLIHPFFGNEERDKLLEIIFPTSSGTSKDPRLNPGVDPKLLGRLGCGNVLIFVAEKDRLKERGRSYYEALKKSGWVGKVEIVENEGEKHVFHLMNPGCHNAVTLVEKTVSFLKQC